MGVDQQPTTDGIGPRTDVRSAHKGLSRPVHLEERLLDEILCTAGIVRTPGEESRPARGEQVVDGPEWRGVAIRVTVHGRGQRPALTLERIPLTSRPPRTHESPETMAGSR